MPDKYRILPPLDYFVAFEASVKFGGFAGASRELHISETAVSRKVRLLEQHYGVALFIRNHRSISLTPKGASLLQFVESSLDKLREASRELLSDTKLNAINLAATNSVSSLWLMPRLRTFNRSNKLIKIKLVSSDNDNECLSDTMDLAILRGDGKWPGFNSQLLFGETIFPVCTPDYLKANPQASELENLQNLDLIDVESTHKEWLNWYHWLEKNGQKNPKLKNTSNFNTYPLSIQAAIDGLGIALGWRHLLDPLIEKGLLVKPLGEMSVRTKSGYYLLKREGSKSFPELTIVENWLLKESESRLKYTLA